MNQAPTNHAQTPSSSGRSIQRYALLFLLLPACAASAQSWQRLQSVPAGAKVQVTTDQHRFVCSFVSATETELTCGKSTVARTEVKKVQLRHKGRGAGYGALIGAGVGAGLGVGIGEIFNNSNSGTLLHVTDNKAAGVGAAVGGVLGAVGGAFIGMASPLGSTTVYKR